MRKALHQGYLDSLCGIYSVVNADSIVNKTQSDESQKLFNSIMIYLNDNGILKDIILDGTDQALMKKLMKDLTGKRFNVIMSNKRSFKNLKEWWNYSKNFLEGGSNRTIILSLGGKDNHLTVVERMTSRTLYLKDSFWRYTIKRSMCKFPDYKEKDKYVIYPAQCWYLGKE